MVPNMVDEIDCANFFDQIDDLIEFPPGIECGVEGNFVGLCDSNDFPSMWSDPFPSSDPLFPGDAPSDLSTELSVPYEDIVQLEWLSTFVEDSFSGSGLTIGKDHPYTKKTEHPQIESRTTSSNSCTSSCSGEKAALLSPNPHPGPQRARSKRPRPTTFSPRHIESFAELGLGSDQKKKKNYKNKKIRISPPVDGSECPVVRKCMHCEITKTPQWRAGPMGPKSLCNACGVRYKSGRLFPEYRPAASPTFVPAMHSNSHKKVLEMRCGDGPGPTGVVPRASKPKPVRSP
ncbi:GATA transcription factor 9 [Striga hermonthica]|uniref:GATA transcription factor n=1 Tax=Striga hermonthica TaxID=68872 RepID=A0A9N7MBI2_STRHE|nr:GATA transcription factor 9 [Striga hermonthica]